MVVLDREPTRPLLAREPWVGQQCLEVAVAARVHVVVAVERPGVDGVGLVLANGPVAQEAILVLVREAGVVDVPEVNGVYLATVGDPVIDRAPEGLADLLCGRQRRSPVADDHKARPVGELYRRGRTGLNGWRSRNICNVLAIPTEATQPTSVTSNGPKRRRSESNWRSS